MILIGFGANLAGRYETPEQALIACAAVFQQRGLRILKSSHIWKTAPVPVSDQPWYRNAVCAVETDLMPEALLAKVKKIERDFGRKSAPVNAPREIDLDILAYHDDVMNGNLCIPHPRLHERAFVLYPLREVAPAWRHPVSGKSVEALITDLPQGQEVERLEGVKLC